MDTNISASQLLKFIFGGNAIFTIKNNKTNNRFTYKIKKIKNKDIYCCSVLTGSDNMNNYSYFGFLTFPSTSQKDFLFHQSNKRKISQDSPSYIAFLWLLNNIVRTGENKFPELEIWHEGRCCRCGRRLTVPESIRAGFGAECATYF